MNIKKGEDMKEVPVVKKDGSIHVLPEDVAKELVYQKQATFYANKMIGSAPKTKAAAVAEKHTKLKKPRKKAATRKGGKKKS